MSVFLDASVIIAILAQEADGEDLADQIAALDGPFYVSSLVRYEATIGLARKKISAGARPTQARLLESRALVDAFIASLGGEEVEIVGEIGDRALSAAFRFGKVIGHPAQLNFGDCFSYACANSKGAALLFKGDDFSKTDILTA